MLTHLSRRGDKEHKHIYQGGVSLSPLLDKCVSILYNNRLMDVLVFFITIP